MILSVISVLFLSAWLLIWAMVAAVGIFMTAPKR